MRDTPSDFHQGGGRPLSFPGGESPKSPPPEDASETDQKAKEIQPAGILSASLQCKRNTRMP